MMDIKIIQDFSELLKDSKQAVVLTGAGISTESGVPDFRSKDGWWNKINPSEVATVGALNNNYTLFRDFYKYRINVLKNCNFNIGHKILAEWEEEGLIKAVVTQNIDGFHRKAGSKKVFELHGSINDIKCCSCGKKDQVKNFMDDELCVACGGKLRPGVVLFGESLSSKVWEKAYGEVSKSDLLVVIGTSLNVSPVNSLPFAARGKKVLVNTEKAQLDNIFDLVIHQSSGMVLSEVNDILRERR